MSQGAIRELWESNDVLEERNKKLMAEVRKLKQQIRELEARYMAYRQEIERPMEGLRRWSPDAPYISFSGDDNGRWVSWHDVQKLRAENERLRTNQQKETDQ